LNATDASKQELRKTGIDAVGDIPWGTHFCHFYETKADLLATLIPYYKTGLENNEFCLWLVVEPLTGAEAATALRNAISNFDRHLEAGSIEIVPYQDGYFSGGVFSAEHAIGKWKAKLAEALSRGYDGIRAHGNEAWLTEGDWKNFLEYEKRLNEVIAGQPMLILCAYPLATRTAAEVFDVAEAHEFATARRQGKWEVFETPELKETKPELTKLKEELEQRIQERTKQLAASNEELRTILDTIPAMVAATDPDGATSYVNRRWLEFYGVKLEVLQGWGWRSVVHPEDEPGLVKEWTAALSTGQPLERQFRMRRYDGEYPWYLVRIVPRRDEHENIIKWYGAACEIDDRVRAEEELRTSERKFRDLVELIPAAVYLCDKAGNITYYNKRSVELWGREPMPGDFSQRYCGSLRAYDGDGKLVPCDQSPVANALRTGQPQYNQELIVERPDRSRITVFANVALIRNEEREVIGVINSFQDITSRKQTEAELKTAFEEIQVLKDQLQKENLVLKEEIDRSSTFEEIVGESSALRAVLSRVAKVAPTESTVLITGETGTGKELIARAIHKRSNRSARPFVAFNCAAIPPSLIATEMFGHERGAFTGAVQRHPGRFELAEGGTIFLDEVGDLPPETQITLLRVLQEHEFERVGGHQTIRADVRVIAATHSDLERAIEAGVFRSDLFYRLNVFPIQIPPLRERAEDIPLLVEYLVGRYASTTAKKIRKISRKTMDRLKSYPWPGNIRELQNVIERSVIISKGAGPAALRVVPVCLSQTSGSA